MLHPFQDKLFLFIGRPTLGSRQTARDALSAVGGVTDDSLTTFTDEAYNEIVAACEAHGIGLIDPEGVSE